MQPERSSWFSRFAVHASHAAGRPLVFAAAAAIVAGWGLLGPLFDYSEWWLLVMHTFASVVTFLLVFLLHNTETRNTEAIQIKLDELLRTANDTNKSLLDLEELDEDDLERIQHKYEDIAARNRSE